MPVPVSDTKDIGQDRFSWLLGLVICVKCGNLNSTEKFAGDCSWGQVLFPLRSQNQGLTTSHTHRSDDSNSEEGPAAGPSKELNRRQKEALKGT